MTYQSRRTKINNELKKINAFMTGETGQYSITGYTPEYEILVTLPTKYKTQQEVLLNIGNVLDSFMTLATGTDSDHANINQLEEITYAEVCRRQEENRLKNPAMLDHWLHDHEGATCDLPPLQISALDRPEPEKPTTIADQINVAKILKLHPHATIVKVIEDVENTTVFYRDSGGESVMHIYQRHEWLVIEVKDVIDKLFPVNQKFHDLKWNLHHNHGQRAKRYLYNLRWRIALDDLEMHIHNIEQRSETVQDFTPELYLLYYNEQTGSRVMSALQAIRDSFKYLMLADFKETQT